VSLNGSCAFELKWACQDAHPSGWRQWAFHCRLKYLDRSGHTGSGKSNPWRAQSHYRRLSTPASQLRVERVVGVALGAEYRLGSLG
jgi:hypothetical protein